MLALECAMDELAERLGFDPIGSGSATSRSRSRARGAFSTRNLVACMQEGARRFSWKRRRSEPGSLREGRKLVGLGMAAAIRPNYIGAAAASVRIDAEGR